MAKGALSAWETGTRNPSGHNLESVLDTLNVREGEKALILAVATPSHARMVLAHTQLGPPIGQSEVLRGLRIRAGLSQQEVARRVGMTQSAIAKWESGDTVLEGEALTRALHVLEAQPEEISAAVSLSNNESSTIRIPQDAETRIHQIVSSVPLPLKDVAFTLLEADLWRRSTVDPRFIRVLVASMDCHAWFLHVDLRTSESQEVAKRAVRLAEDVKAFDEALFAGYLVYSNFHINGLKYHKRPIGLYEKWSTGVYTSASRASVANDRVIEGLLIGNGYKRNQAEYLELYGQVLSNKESRHGIFRYTTNGEMFLDHLPALYISGGYEDVIDEAEENKLYFADLPLHTVFKEPELLRDRPGQWCKTSFVVCSMIQLGQPIPAALWQVLNSNCKYHSKLITLHLHENQRELERRIKLV